MNNTQKITVVLLCILFLVIGYVIADFNFNKYADEFCQVRKEKKESDEYMRSAFMGIPKKDNSLHATSTMYEVKKGDSLETISVIFGISKESIIVANNLKSEKVSIGELIIIPSTQ